MLWALLSAGRFIKGLLSLMPTQTDTQSQVARKLNFAIQGAALQTAVCSLNSNGNVTHVVTVGGLAAALAASAATNTHKQGRFFLWSEDIRRFPRDNSAIEFSRGCNPRVPRP